MALPSLKEILIGASGGDPVARFALETSADAISAIKNKLMGRKFDEYGFPIQKKKNKASAYEDDFTPASPFPQPSSIRTNDSSFGTSDVVLERLQEISDNTKELVRIASGGERSEKSGKLDELEGLFEGKKESISPGAKKSAGSGKNLVKERIQSMIGNGITGVTGGIAGAGAFLAAGAAKSLVSVTAGAILSVAINGILGYFKAEEWGTSKTSGIIGGILAGTSEDPRIRALQAGGSMAMVGAKIGTAFAPGIGTIIGAVIGGAVGGLLGYFVGGKRLAKFVDTMGEKIVKGIKDAITYITELFDSLVDGVYSAVDWVIDKSTYLLNPSTGFMLRAARQARKAERAAQKNAPKIEEQAETKMGFLDSMSLTSPIAKAVNVATNFVSSAWRESGEKTQQTQKPVESIRDTGQNNSYDANDGSLGETLMRGIRKVETGSGNPWIRTNVKAKLGEKKSSAWGPFQITYSLAQSAKNNGVFKNDPALSSWVDRFIAQGKKFIRANDNDPVYGNGGPGELTSNGDRKNYMKMANLLATDVWKSLDPSKQTPENFAAVWHDGINAFNAGTGTATQEYIREGGKSIRAEMGRASQSVQLASLLDTKSAPSVSSFSEMPFADAARQISKSAADAVKQTFNVVNNNIVGNNSNNTSASTGSGQTKVTGPAGSSTTTPSALSTLLGW